jgi:hypothetical protein
MTWVHNFGKWLVRKPKDTKFNKVFQTVNTIAGGLGLVTLAGVGLGAVGGVTGLTGLLTTGGKTVAKKKFLGGLFKKKAGGTVLGNILRGAGSSAVESVGADVGSIAHNIAGKIGASVEGDQSVFGKGFKEGFLGQLWEKNRGLVMVVGLGVLALLGWLIFGKKRR